MAKYDKDTKFFWLMLKDDFFENDAISWLEEQEPNGKEYAYFYLKLCVSSLKTNGLLIRKVGQILVPYDAKRLSELTRIDFDTVVTAMSLLQKIGLVQVLETGEIYLPEIVNLIGSQSKGAFKKQQQRALNSSGGQMSTQCLPNCPPNLKSKILEDRKIDNNIINLLNSDNFFEKIKFVQDETDKYNNAFLEKGVYINNSIVDIKRLNRETVLQIMLTQNLIKKLVDSKSAELYEKLNINIIEKILSKMLEQKKIDNPINYFITSYQNEVIKNGW